MRRGGASMVSIMGQPPEQVPHCMHLWKFSPLISSTFRTNSRS